MQIPVQSSILKNKSSEKGTKHWQHHILFTIRDNIEEYTIIEKFPILNPIKSHSFLSFQLKSRTKSMLKSQYIKNKIMNCNKRKVLVNISNKPLT